MFEIGKKYGLRITAPQPSVELKEQLPIWYPIGQAPGKRRLYTSRECQCLRTKHNISTAGDARALTRILDNPRHKPRRNCSCNDCWLVRHETHCENPHKCADEAEKLLDNLDPKWDPRASHHAVQPLTRRERRHNERAEKTGGPIIFDPSYEVQRTLADNFRIF
ncbi:hypothetical protein K523DRAFT_221908, partial [Schizophyllum commune Tattone D]